MLDIEVAKIHRLEGDGATKAFCDIIVSDALLIKGIRIMDGKNGLFVKMPTKQGKDGRWHLHFIRDDQARAPSCLRWHIN